MAWSLQNRIWSSGGWIACNCRLQICFCVWRNWVDGGLRFYSRLCYHDCSIGEYVFYGVQEEKKIREKRMAVTWMDEYIDLEYVLLPNVRGEDGWWT